MRTPLGPNQLRELERNLRDIQSRGFRDGAFGGQFGDGFAPDGVRPWQPTDRVQRLHRAATERMGESHVWYGEPELAANAVGVIDLSPSMYFGTVQFEKIDVASGVAYAFAWLYSNQGNQFASVPVGQYIEDHPFRGDAMVSARLYDFLSGVHTPDGTEVQLTQGIELARMRYHNAEEAVVVSDFRSKGWEEELRRLSWERRLTVFHTVDPWDEELPDSGEAAFVDPVTGQQRVVYLSGRRGRKIRDKYKTLARDRKKAIKDAVKDAGAQYVVLRTDNDWIADLTTALKQGGE